MTFSPREIYKVSKQPSRIFDAWILSTRTHIKHLSVPIDPSTNFPTILPVHSVIGSLLAHARGGT